MCICIYHCCFIFFIGLLQPRDAHRRLLRSPVICRAGLLRLLGRLPPVVVATTAATRGQKCHGPFRPCGRGLIRCRRFPPSFFVLFPPIAPARSSGQHGGLFRSWVLVFRDPPLKLLGASSCFFSYLFSLAISLFSHSPSLSLTVISLAPSFAHSLSLSLCFPYEKPLMASFLPLVSLRSLSLVPLVSHTLSFSISFFPSKSSIASPLYNRIVSNETVPRCIVQFTHVSEIFFAKTACNPPSIIASVFCYFRF